MRTLLIASDSLPAESISSVLAEEIDLEVIQVAHRELGKGQPYSMVIVVDEEEPENKSIQATDLIRDEITLVVMMERVIHIVQEFGRMNPQKN